jgi:hypothetical protein
VFRVFVGISHRDGNFLASMIFAMLKYIAEKFSRPEASLPQQTLIDLPTTLRSILGKFSLDGEMITYAVCPECHANYGSVAGKYPQRCSNKPMPESTCNAELLNACSEPIKMFAQHSFSDYLGGLFSRADIERHLSQPPADLDDVSPSFIRSPFYAKFAREFHGPDAQALFLRAVDPNEARLIFTFYID